MRLDKLRELTAAERRVIAAAACILGMLAVHHWLVSPHLASLRAAQRYEQATDTIMDQSKTKSRQLQIKRLALERMRTEQAALAEGIFRPAEVEPFFGDVEHLCTETGCVVLSCRYIEKNTPLRRGGSDANAPALRKAARLEVQGKYPDLRRFVQKLQTYPRKVWIDTVDIASMADTSVVTGNLDISIYIFRNKESEGHE